MRISDWSSDVCSSDLWTFKGRALRLVDTAGLRRKARVVEKLERLSTQDALRSIRFAQVVVLLLDVEEWLEKQDLTIARMVWTRAARWSSASTNGMPAATARPG